MSAQEQRQEQFIATFNAELDQLNCGARVNVVPGSTTEMDIVDLSGGLIGRIPCGIEPDAFAAFMLIVEETFEQGKVWRDDVQRLASTGGTTH